MKSFLGVFSFKNLQGTFTILTKNKTPHTVKIFILMFSTILNAIRSKLLVFEVPAELIKSQSSYHSLIVHYNFFNSTHKILLIQQFQENS